MKSPALLPSSRRRFVLGIGATWASINALLGAGDSAAKAGGQMTEADELRQRAASNLAAVERYAAAWRANDLSAAIECYHPEFTLHYFGHNPLSGDHVGLKAAAETLAKIAQRTKRTLVKIVDVMAGADRAIIIAREAFDRGDLHAELDRVLVYTVTEGKLHDCWVYDTDQALIDRFFAD